MQGDDARDVLIGIIRRIASSSQPISDETRLLHDLSISGDDAFEVLSEIEKRFGPFTVGMEFDDYFPNETESMWYRRGKFLGLWMPKRELTVGDLLTCIKAGRWML